MKRGFEFFSGIDPSWTGKYPTAVTVLDRGLHLVDFVYSEKIDEILEPLKRYPNVIVGVDAPLIVTNESGHRPNEREFLRYFARFGLSLYPVNKKRYPFFFPELLYERLKEIGYSFESGNVFEVYPHATIMVLFNDTRVFHYKRGSTKERLEKLRWLEARIRELVDIPSHFVVPKNAVKAYEDFLDSLICGLTVAFSTERACLTFGDEESGLMLVLKPS
ncbi:DUF429 domain-containing protein [Pseudothermotoga sp.]